MKMETMANPFLTPSLALTLDGIGQAYSVRPSELMGFMSEGRALMFDIKVRTRAQREIDRAQAESKTVKGEYMTKQRDWPEWASDKSELGGKVKP